MRKFIGLRRGRAPVKTALAKRTRFVDVTLTTTGKRAVAALASGEAREGRRLD